MEGEEADVAADESEQRQIREACDIAGFLEDMDSDSDSDAAGVSPVSPLATCAVPDERPEEGCEVAARAQSRQSEKVGSRFGLDSICGTRVK